MPADLKSLPLSTTAYSLPPPSVLHHFLGHSPTPFDSPVLIGSLPDHRWPPLELTDDETPASVVVATSSMPNFLGEPHRPPPCLVPPSCRAQAFTANRATLEPPAKLRRPCHRECPGRGDHAVGACPRHAGWPHRPGRFGTGPGRLGRGPYGLVGHRVSQAAGPRGQQPRVGSGPSTIIYQFLKICFLIQNSRKFC
jgi:hypothetical protein